MYSNENNPGFNWKDLLLKLVFVIIFILLLIWLFKINTPNMKPFYSNQFRENIKYMQDAAESYYTNERLPKVVGDSAEITLREMIDKNLILEFVDEDGNGCDLDKSYVQVTKNENDYTLKTNLVCPKEKNTVIKTLGCYNYCEDCKEDDKTVEVTEYQFKKPVTKTSNVNTCPNGGEYKSGKCYVYASKTYQAAEIKTDGKEYCPNGGTLKNGKCVITKEDSYKAYTTTTKDTYTCPSGYTLNGTKCTKSVTSTDTKDATVKYSCPSGYKLNGTKCTKTTSSTDTKNATVSYSCPSGYTLNSSTKKCTGKTTGTSTIDATWIESGREYVGGTYYGSKPSGYTCSTSTQYICSSSSFCPGVTKVYTSCYKTIPGYYTCPSGYTKNGSTCTKSTSSTKTVDATPSYTCPSGYTKNGSRCTKTTSSTDTKNATATKTCQTGYTLNNGKCTKKVTSTDTKNATLVKGTTKTFCDSKDGSPKNGMCYRTVTSSYNPSKVEGSVSYACLNGGTLNSSSKTCTVTSLVSEYTATVVTKTSTAYQYKWSTEEKLEGWTRTGATRTSIKKVEK